LQLLFGIAAGKLTGSFIIHKMLIFLIFITLLIVFKAKIKKL